MLTCKSYQGDIINGDEDHLCCFLRNYVKENFENGTYNKVK